MRIIAQAAEEVSLARRAQKARRSKLREMPFATAKPGIISFAGEGGPSAL
jgi:hypothetical protein